MYLSIAYDYLNGVTTGRIPVFFFFFAKLIIPPIIDIYSLSISCNTKNQFKLLRQMLFDTQLHIIQLCFTLEFLILTFVASIYWNNKPAILGFLQVRSTILDEVREAKYYCLMFDSTPDISHKDQFVQVLRYVKISDGKVHIMERFVDFLPIEGRKTAELLTDAILEKLEADGLDIQDCRGQGFDNAATMAGKDSGVQKRIRNINNKAAFVPCSNHSTNLSAVYAAYVNNEVIIFFTVIDKTYSFFAASTNRWSILLKHLGVALKRRGDTRWCSTGPAVRVHRVHLQEIVAALTEVRDGTEETPDTKAAAEGLLRSILKFQFLAYLNLWDTLLTEVNKTHIYLQTKAVDLQKARKELDRLQCFLDENRDDMVMEAMAEAEATCQEFDITIEARRRRVVPVRPGEQAKDAPLSIREELRRGMLEVSLCLILLKN